MGDDLCVRVDFYGDGKMVPISFVQNKVVTKYIRKIKRICYETDSQSQETTRYFCLLNDKTTATLSYKNGQWHIEESIYH